MKKIGGTQKIPYRRIEKDEGIIAANKKAISHFKGGGASPYLVEAATFETDLRFSINRTRIEYSCEKNKNKLKAYLPTEKYTFLDTEEGKSPDVPLPFLKYYGILCGWKGGSIVSDQWMADLETYGFAKAFKVDIRWTVDMDK